MNKCAMVTGGSGNIGGGIAVVLAEHGYDLAITYAGNREGAERTRQAVEAAGRRCFVYQASLEKPEIPAQVIARAHRNLGRLDLMVCNAGRDGRNSVLTATAEDFDRLYAANFRAYCLCAGAAARHMVKDGIPGSIIMISSTRGEQAYPDDFIYGGLKAAVNRACRSMALDLSKYNIRVNCVSPGATWPEGAPNRDSPFVRESIPLHRVGSARENGEAVAFLASDAASYITGVTLRVDGGLILPGMMERSEKTEWVREDWREQQKKKAMDMLNEQMDGAVKG